MHKNFIADVFREKGFGAVVTPDGVEVYLKRNTHKAEIMEVLDSEFEGIAFNVKRIWPNVYRVSEVE